MFALSDLSLNTLTFVSTYLWIMSSSTLYSPVVIISEREIKGGIKAVCSFILGLRTIQFKILFNVIQL